MMARLIIAALTVFAVAVFWPGQAEQLGPPPEANIACKVLWVHDGDTMRCDGYRKSSRLYGIDAPEMPGACKPGRACTPGDPYASRDHLISLIKPGGTRCQLIDVDDYDRPVMRCWTGQTDLSCAMVKSGLAVERYGTLNCRR